MDDWQVLVKKALTGDTEAFGALVEVHSDLVVNLSRATTGDANSAEDLAQETFLKAYRSLGNLREPEKFRSWLCGIARNVALEWLRQRGRSATEVPLSNAEQSAAEISGDDPQNSNLVWEKINRLPEDQRRAVVMKYSQGLSYAEIGEALEVPASTVRGLLYRALKTLRGEMPQEQT